MSDREEQTRLVDRSPTSVERIINEKKNEKRTGEHTLKLVGVLETTGLFELGDHARLGVVRSRDLVNQTLRQPGTVEGLEDILVLDILEDDHL